MRLRNSSCFGLIIRHSGAPTQLCAGQLEIELIKVLFTRHPVRLSTAGTSARVGKDFGCLDVRRIQMFMTVLSSSRKIRWPEGRKKLCVYVRTDEL